MQVTSQYLICVFLTISLPLAFLFGIAAHFDAKHVHNFFMNDNLKQGSERVLPDNTVLQLYQKQIVPFDQKQIGKQYFLIGLFVQTEKEIDTLWCDDWQATPLKTAMTVKKNGLERIKLPIEYFHSCQWLFDQLQLHRHTLIGQSIRYTKNQNDILYSVSIADKTILGQEQAYKFYHDVYASKIRARNHWLIFFMLCGVVGIFHFRKTLISKFKKP